MVFGAIAFLVQKGPGKGSPNVPRLGGGLGSPFGVVGRKHPGDLVCRQIRMGGALSWKKGKDPHPQDKIQHLDFTKDPRPLYYKTTTC